MMSLERISSWYSRLANLGVNQTQQEDQKKKKLLNILCIIWYHASVLFLISSWWLSSDLWQLTLQHALLSIAVYGLVQYLNMRGYAEAAKALFLGSTLVQCIFFSVVVRPGELIELFTFTLPLVAVVLYNRFAMHFSVLIVSLATTLMSLFVFQDYDLPAIVAVVITLVYVTSFLLVVYLKQLNQEKEVLLAVERNKALADKSLIEEQAEELRALNEFKNHFFVNISHEIRTPLTLISGYARRLTSQTEAGSTSRYAQGITEQSAAIKHLVDSIIDLSKLDEKKLTLSKTDVNLTRLLRKVHAEFSDTFAQRGLSLLLDLPDKTFTVACDLVLMNRVVTNLITNALKFTGPDGTARLSMHQDEKNDVRIEVYNTGIGIPPDDQAKIFDRFYQVENDITRSQGSGIGLSMTQGILEHHGYRIEVKSEPNRYALFTISIPAREVDVTPTEAVNVPEATPLVKKSSNKSRSVLLLPGSTRILLVEDNAAMREYIRAIEGMRAYAILEARHGDEALELLQRHEVDLIITDYMMPHMDGQELISQIKRRGYAQPMLVITAQTDPQHKLDMLRMGIDGYLTKPFFEEEFLLLIQKSLKYDEARRQFIAQEVGNEGVPLPESALDDFNQQLKAVIDQNIDNEEFSVGALGEQLHLTERTLFRRVKELCGCTPAKLITEARLMRAKTYYDQKVYRSTRQLARAVGFKNSTRFAEKFRERFGVAP